ncbi:PTS 2-O-a-mannosyl-D-glycerate transporter subunit IIABC [Aliivibrio sifiae]|uniref:PTS 2-O-a-mannosyl-D-glycerate transporter subunit IIABC n=1 Tax=Aliivibrio sifiae TaxID=566293 RepID=A0A2S7X620_9GAMM|nr:PTS 2-O-a-mannosyl-D-glycerate transporter subunit IIABC [Aliivibrio sifiae]PQJ86818.1 PTS 2-O-a-mannosyl-D-glycerate transporter subunit IIABC [Aliivibrio sifiae]GLR74064.1 PTS system 2-O-alpha-mannosyl-D-glycerate-specific EIIABC component [Aliivibrio sifiae]
MKLTTLTNKSLINLQTTFNSREEAIYALADQLEQQGKLHNKDEYLEAVFAREVEGPTALGEGLAVPHGKTDAVKEAAFAVATLTRDLKWKGVDEDEDEDVNLIFLIAIPNAEAGSTHMHLLTELTTTLVDDDVREAVLNATTAEEIFALFDGHKEKEIESYNLDTNAPTIVCVTACPAGIAHTYMAAEYLEKAGKKLGYNVHVEKQGANGIEDRITAEQLNKAVACVFAAEVAIKDVERFKGIPRVEIPVAEPIRHAERILNDAIEESKKGRSADFVEATDDKPKKLPLKTELKQALLSGISFAVPLIIAGGTVLAVAVLIAQIFDLQELYATDGSWLWMYRKLGGGLLGTLMVPVLAAYTAYSLADKPALGPGFAAGLAANLIGAGFLGGVVGGLLAGYVMRWVKENIRLAPAFNGFLTFYLYPVIGTLVVGSLMLFVIGKPVAFLNQGLTDWLNGLSGTNAILLGAVLGCFVSFDLGGPVNKAAYAFCLGAMANGVYGPYAIFGSVKMVSAFTVTASTMIAPRLFKDFEIETGKSTWLLGLAGITEGAIPMAIEDPIRVIGSFLVGSIVTGAMVGAAGVGLSTPGAGIFSLFLLQDGGLGSFTAAAVWLGAALIGTVISTSILIMWRGHAVKKGKLELQKSEKVTAATQN